MFKNIKIVLSSFLAERTFIISDASKVRSFHLTKKSYAFLFLIFFICFLYIFYSFISLKIKEYGLSRIYSEKSRLENENKVLSEKISTISVELQQINGYLLSTGRDISAYKKNKKIGNIKHSNDDEIKIIEVSMSGILDKITSRSDYFIRIAKHMLPSSKIAMEKRINFDMYSASESEKYQKNLTSEIKRAASIENEIKYMPVGDPLLGHKITGRYGNRLHPVSKKIKRHNGMDLSSSEGATIYATGSGVVKFSGQQNGYGNIIEISHRNGIVTKYAHLKKMFVKAGNMVQIGQPIGLQGHTGSSCTGSHLHYEVLVAGKHHNPYNFISAQKYVKRQTASTK